MKQDRAPVGNDDYTQAMAGYTRRGEQRSDRARGDEWIGSFFLSREMPGLSIDALITRPWVVTRKAIVRCEEKQKIGIEQISSRLACQAL